MAKIEWQSEKNLIMRTPIVDAKFYYSSFDVCTEVFKWYVCAFMTMHESYKTHRVNRKPHIWLRIVNVYVKGHKL